MPLDANNPINRYGQISAAAMAGLVQAARKLGQVSLNAGDLDYSGGLVGNPQGSAISLGDGLLLAGIFNSDGGSPKRYSWSEYDRTTLQPVSGGLVGYLNARDINGLDVALGTLVFLVSDGAGGYLMDAGGLELDREIFLGCDGDEPFFATLHFRNGRLVGVT